jgi:hypothetical protein
MSAFFKCCHQNRKIITILYISLVLIPICLQNDYFHLFSDAFSISSSIQLAYHNITNNNHFVRTNISTAKDIDSSSESFTSNNRDIQECPYANDAHGRSRIVGINATQSLPSYSKENAADGNTNTTWRPYNLNGSSLEIDLGCEKTLSTIDIAWHNVDGVEYQFDLQVLSDSGKQVKRFNFTSNNIPSEMAYQSFGTDNTKGRYIKIVLLSHIDSSKKGINELGIDEVNVYVIPPTPLDYKKINLDRWNLYSYNFPQALRLVNSTGNSVDIPLTTIIEGDSDPIRNPYYQFPSNPVMDLHIGRPFMILANISHVEGINVEVAPSSLTSYDTSSYKIDDSSEYNNLRVVPITVLPLNNAEQIYNVGNNTKLFMFIPYLGNNGSKSTIEGLESLNDLIISIAVSEDSSVIFKTRVIFRS